MFFEKTKKTLDNWVNMLVGFAGQEIFLIMTLSFFNILIYNFIRSTFNYTVCWMGILNMNLAGIPLSLISFWKIPSSNLVGNLNTLNESMPSFYSIMSFYIVGVLMSKFVTGSAELGSSIFGSGGGGMPISGGMAGLANAAVSRGADGVGQFMKNTGVGFAKSAAGRMGGNSIKNFADRQAKERSSRREKRDNHFKEVDSATKNKLNEYKESTQFQTDLQNERNKDPGYANLSKKDKAKADEKSTNAILNSKEKEFRNDATVESVKNNYQGEIQRAMEKNGEDGKFGDLDDQAQKEHAEKFAKNMGLL
jgi:hypothetical protein